MRRTVHQREIVFDEEGSLGSHASNSKRANLAGHELEEDDQSIDSFVSIKSRDPPPPLREEEPTTEPPEALAPSKIIVPTAREPKKRFGSVHGPSDAKKAALRAFKAKRKDVDMVTGGDHASARADYAKVADAALREEGAHLQHFHPRGAPERKVRSSVEDVKSSYAPVATPPRLKRMLRENSPFSKERGTPKVPPGGIGSLHAYNITNMSGDSVATLSSPSKRAVTATPFSPKARGRLRKAADKIKLGNVLGRARQGLGEAHMHIHTISRPTTPDDLGYDPYEIASWGNERPRSPDGQVLTEAELVALMEEEASRPSGEIACSSIMSETPTEAPTLEASHRRTFLGNAGLLQACGGHRLPAPKLLEDGTGWSTEVTWEYRPLSAPQFLNWPNSKRTPPWCLYMFALTYLHRYGWNRLDETGGLDEDPKVRVRPASPSGLGGRCAPGERELFELGEKEVADEDVEPVIQALRRLQREGHLATDHGTRLHFTAGEAGEWLRGPGLKRFVQTRDRWWRLLASAPSRALIVTHLRRAARTVSLGPRSPDFLSEETTYATTLKLRKRRLAAHRRALDEGLHKLAEDDPAMALAVDRRSLLRDKNHYSKHVRRIDEREIWRRAHAQHARASAARGAARRARNALDAKKMARAREVAEVNRRRRAKSRFDGIARPDLPFDDESVLTTLRDEIVEPQPRLPWSPWELDPVLTISKERLARGCGATPFKWDLDEDDVALLDRRSVVPHVVHTNSAPPSRPSTAPPDLAMFDDDVRITSYVHLRPVSPTTSLAQQYLSETSRTHMTAAPPTGVPP